MVDVTVVGADALEHDDDHVWVNGAVIAVHDGLVVIHNFGMRGLERAERHHVQIFLEALKFDRFRVWSIGPSMRRKMGGHLAGFEIQEIKSFVC